jgi:hypothetical protein
MVQMVADSSALILLAKCNLLEIVCDLFDVIVPKAVSIEVASEDLVKNYPDAYFIINLSFIRLFFVFNFLAKSLAKSATLELKDKI